MATKIVLKEGEVFGMLTYIKDSPYKVLPSGQKIRVAYCKCGCGNYKDILVVHLVRGKITTCGCVRAAYGDKGTPVHNIWRGMMNRCKPAHFQSEYYFDKGITVCEEWRQFRNFKEWALSNGYQEGLQIDRKKNDKGYSPENCRFVTQQENLHNRDITTKVVIDGVEMSFWEYYQSVDAKVSYETAFRRFKMGWSLSKSVLQSSQSPLRNNKPLAQIKLIHKA